MNRFLLLFIFLFLSVASCGRQAGDKSPSAVKEVIEVAGRQGVACDGEYYYVSGSTALYKYSLKGELLLTNETPFLSITEGTPAPNHIGDIDIYDGEIYAGCEYFMDGEGQNIQVAIYDAATLLYKRSITWEKESGQVECCGLAVDRKRHLVWMADWVDGSYLYCYDLSTGAYHGKVALTPPPALQQGIFCMDSGDILLSCDDGDADKDEADHLYVCHPYKGEGKALLNEATVSTYMTMSSFRRAGEIEGLCVNPATGDLVVLSNRGARIVLGMPKGFYDGYDREIHELYVFSSAHLPIIEQETPTEMNKIKISVGENSVSATLANNSSAKSFAEKLKEGPVTVAMSDYGNFEKVGALGFSLPRNDESITTVPGDIILYQGNQITIYYDTNTWTFTRLGKVDNISQAELKAFLGNGNVTVAFSLQ